MFTRFVAESIRRAPRRKAMAIAAVAMGSAVATAMLGIRLEVGDKVNRELRTAGANILVTPKSLAQPFIPESEITKIKTIFWALNITGFAPSMHASWQGIPVEGAWFRHRYKNPPAGRGAETPAGLIALNPSWKITGNWIDDTNDAPVYDCMAGEQLATQLHLKPGSTIALFGQDFRVAGIFSSGGDLDNEILVRLGVLQTLTHRPGQVDVLQVAALTKPEDAFARRDPNTMTSADKERWLCTNYVSSIAHEIAEVLPMADARPVRRIAESEGLVLSRIGGLMLLSSLAALICSGLTVWSVMAATMLERRGEIAIMQATGASGFMIVMLFGAEVAIEGLLGGVIGIALGYVLAGALGRAVFQSAVAIPAILPPLVLLIAVAVALSGAAWPMRRSLSIDPALVLREGV